MSTTLDTAAALAEVREAPAPAPPAETRTLRLADVQPAAAAVAFPRQPAPADPPSRVVVTAELPPHVAAPSAEAPVQSYPLTVVNGETLGAITLRDGGASEPAIHLGALLELVRLRMPEAEFLRLSGAAAADRFVPLDELRAAGIAVQFDPRENRLLIGAR